MLAYEKMQSVSADQLFIKSSFTLILSGSSGCGKTMFFKKLIESNIIQPPPSQIVICYGVNQRLYYEINTSIPIIRHEGFSQDLLSTMSPGSLLFIDDLMNFKTDQFTEIFTKFSHHMSISCIFVTQNLFLKELRTLSLNAMFIVLFKSIRNVQQISTLGSQLGLSKFLSEIFKDATVQPYSHLLLDMRSQTSENLRFRSNIFNEHNLFSIVYTQKPKL
jgi:hypothetical protein